MQQSSKHWKNTVNKPKYTTVVTELYEQILNRSARAHALLWDCLMDINDEKLKSDIKKFLAPEEETTFGKV